jgi:hypothetical protein
LDGIGKSRAASVLDTVGALTVASLVVGLRGFFGVDLLSEPVCRRNGMKIAGVGGVERETMPKSLI